MPGILIAILDFSNKIKTTVTTILTHLTTNLSATRSAKIDNLDTNIASRATQASVDISNNNIGTTANTGGTNTAGTVMAKLNALLNTWTATKAGYIDTTISSRASSTDATNIYNLVASKEGEEIAAVRYTNLYNLIATMENDGNANARYAALAAILGAVNTNTARGSVKSVQRGISLGSYQGSAGGVVNISISTINPQKSSASISGSQLWALGGENTKTQAIVSLTSNVITVSLPWISNFEFSWEIVEFY